MGIFFARKKPETAQRRRRTKPLKNQRESRPVEAEFDPSGDFNGIASAHIAIAFLIAWRTRF